MRTGRGKPREALMKCRKAVRRSKFSVRRSTFRPARPRPSQGRNIERRTLNIERRIPEASPAFNQRFPREGAGIEVVITRDPGLQIFVVGGEALRLAFLDAKGRALGMADEEFVIPAAGGNIEQQRPCRPEAQAQVIQAAGDGVGEGIRAIPATLKSEASIPVGRRVGE